MEEGRKLMNASNELYNVAKNASDEAKKAQEDGLKVAKDAKEMLELLLVCKYYFLTFTPLQPTYLSFIIINLKQGKQQFSLYIY